MRLSRALAPWLLGALACAASACASLGSSESLPGGLQKLADRQPSAAEKAVLQEKGFVITALPQQLSFHAGYAALFKAHAPVYFTADAILHALHRSFDKILTRVEEAVLIADLGTFLGDLRGQLERDTTTPPQTRADVDLYLAVAQSLLDGKAAATVASGDKEQIATLVKGAEAASGMAEAMLFGAQQPVDYSMFKPRGHYTKSQELSRYFRAMTWLGVVELRLAGKKPDGSWEANQRTLAAAALLAKLRTPAAEAAWQRIDRTVGAFVGPPDSMSFPGLSRALATLGYPAKPLDAASGEDVARALLPFATQRIRGGIVGPGEQLLSFLPLGKRFVFDSSIFTRTTYSALPTKRLMPSPLDVASTVFHNPAAEMLLAPELQRFGYRDVLTTIRADWKQEGPALAEKNIYHGWLRALEELSPDAERDSKLPATFRSEPWQRRMLDTQLASWAELRHDTVLYAKESYTVSLLCEYPDGYVEPYPAFFASVERMAELARKLSAELDFRKEKPLQDSVVAYFGKLAATSAQLRGMAERERESKPLTSDQVDFLNKAVSYHSHSGGCTTIWTPEGWYADLYYDRDDVETPEPVVADVHTQPTDEDGNPVGRVLHVATGYPRLITVRIETCKGPQIFQGMVSSYHETITGNFERLTDEAWVERLRKEPPEDPAWLKDLVVKE
jgi:hypothetical protein